MAFAVSGSSSDGLDERAGRTQKAFLVRVENGHQRHFGNVQTFSQQIDAHEHVKDAGAQIADDFYTLDRINVRMQVTNAHVVFAQILGEFFCHALGKRRHQNALARRSPFVDFGKHIVDLRECRTHFHFRIHKPRGAHHLFDNLRALFQFVRGRRSRHENRTAHLALELIEPQRSVVQSRGQAETVLHKRFLAGTVAAVHAPELPHHHVTFVKKHDAVGRQIVNETRRRFSGSQPREVA